jgi:citrate synthase
VPEDRFLTTAEAADRLDVKPETIYAYASRGLLTSVRGGSRRGSLFAEAEVDRLAGRGRDGRRPAGAVERIRTELTLLADDELYYRGRRVADLAGAWTAESVAQLLWHGGPPRVDVFAAPPELVEIARAAGAALPTGARLTDHLRVAVAAAGAADPLRFDLASAAVRQRAEAIVALLVDALPASTERAGGSLAARLWPALAGRAGTPADVALLDAVLVLLADHDLAVSTLAARVAASARAHPYAVVAAGLGAIDGHHHGTASSLAHAFLVAALPDPVGALADRLRSGAPLPGFGHRVYQRRDPRAEVLFTLLRRSYPDAPVLAAVDALAAHASGTFPNVDLALAAVMHAAGLRPDAGETMFAVARTVGWLAHAMEEYRESPLRFRPVGVYRGERPRG